MAKAPNPKKYKAPHPVYTGGRLYNPGEIFVTAEEPGREWEEVSTAEKRAQDASDPLMQGDPPLESLSLEALKAVAVTKRVNPEGLNKKDLLAAIKAADEPAL